ncbi:MAG: tRNA (adenosine(37)-N6)-threonylcarbamoyltransferase complex ATPase subunit type 1 TsaE [Moraxellaceae bacterium]|nr:MAG: tRNA (adenosine(37)-N6)-threonylcarbamoyltransferase complex ATPase subunit type 1 TsaE [Moraxellaceae bacterium]
MIVIQNEMAMKKLGEAIGKLLHGGEVIQLVGDVGAGKTTFVKGLAVGLSIDEAIQSPTFTISRLYDARNDLRLAHYDFYRLGVAGIMADELSEVVRDDATVTVIEWADIVDDVLPKDTLTITILATSIDERQVTLDAGGTISKKLAKAFV